MAEQTTSEVKTERTGGAPEVQQELSKVAASPKQSILILVGICGIFGYLFFNLFINKKDTVTSNEPTVAVPTQVSKPAEAAVEAPKIPQLPDLPKLVAPQEAPSPPATTPEILPATTTTTPTLTPEALPTIDSAPILNSVLPIANDSEEVQKRKDAKRTSTIILLAGVEKKTQDQIQQEKDFVKRGNMELVLGRGKIIDAILETAIDSDIGGEVRAVVSRDVYSERHKVILIPKGTRVFGTYTTQTQSGANTVYGRILIQWFRVHLTTGYTLLLEPTPVVDNLGRAGVAGRVDNKYKEQISNALLTSVFNIASASALSKIVPPPTSSQAATINTTTATNIQNISQTMAAQISPTSTPQAILATVAQICAQTQAAITDPTSTAYQTMNQACTTIGTIPSAAQLQTIQNAVNTAAASLTSTAAASTTPTPTQAAAQQALTNLSTTFDNMLGQYQFTPTTTINQGTLVRIYVNRDYIFPKAALSTSRLIK